MDQITVLIFALMEGTFCMMLQFVKWDMEEENDNYDM